MTNENHFQTTAVITPRGRIMRTQLNFQQVES